MSPGQRYEASGPANASALGQPLSFHFSGRTAKNRLMKAAMNEKLSSWSDNDMQLGGIPTKQLIELYRRWGERENNWGMIITGNISIELDHPISRGNGAITLESPFAGDRFEAFRQLASAGKANGSLIIAQMNHPGRQASADDQPHPISASAVQLAPTFGTTFGEPRAATKADIARIVASFGHAAQYLERAGFDGMELHGAHGYLLAQFLSKTTNQRTDEYGGSVANRARILVEVAREARRRTSVGFVLGAKLNSVEFQEGGFTPQEAAELCAILQDEVGLDFVELSGGTYERMALHWERESTRRREAFFLEFAELVVPALGSSDRRRTRVYLTGGLRTVPRMVEALELVDGVGIGRPSTQEPHLAADILEGRVAGAVQPVEPFDNDTGLGLLASEAQMAEIADGGEPFDLSNPEDVAAFQKDIAAFFSKPHGGPIRFGGAGRA
ncbi:hypothetical protein RB594_005636 [Gaeumannomyces avenae]